MKFAMRLALLLVSIVIFTTATIAATKWGPFRCDLGSDVSGDDNGVGVPVAIHFPIHVEGKEDRRMCVYYEELFNWRSVVSQVLEKISATEGNDTIQYQAALPGITDLIEQRLRKMGYPPEYVQGAGLEHERNAFMPAEFLLPGSKYSDEVSKQILEAMYRADTMTNSNKVSDEKKPSIILKSSQVSRKEELNEEEVEAYPVELNVVALNATASIGPDLFVINARSAKMVNALSNPVRTTRNLLHRHLYRKNGAAAILNAEHTKNMHSKASCALQRRHEAMFIVYQTRHVRTGGTVALDSLYRQLHDLIGDNAFLCNEDNHMSPVCSNPPKYAVAITGEWCHEVLEDHGIPDGHFQGRGIQYHLGFHHDGDICAGHIAMTDSQYLATYLHTRVMSAYFLGCPMTKRISDHYAGMLMATQSTGVMKENLIVIDPDLGEDYAPEEPVHYELPVGVRGVMAKDIHPDDMPLLLHRAKVTMDLALPGPERLSGEGAMLGAVPIISSRWNGASDVDFPGVLRVDAQNGTAITEMIAHAFSNYDSITKSERNAEFVSYIMSLDDRLQNTLGIVTQSASMHFILKPLNLAEEKVAAYLVMAISYLFPLASINVYVKDVLWFSRHHYPLLNVMNNGGVSRHDPFTPEKHRKLGKGGFSQVKILSHEQLLNSISTKEGESDDDTLLPSWAVTPVLLSVKSSIATSFANAHQLLNRITKYSTNDPSDESISLTGLDVYASRQSRPFATVLPFSGDHNCGDLKQKRGFLQSVETFFMETKDEESLHEKIILSESSVRTVSRLMDCENSYDINTSRLQDIVDALPETAAWQTLQTYYCNIRSD